MAQKKYGWLKDREDYQYLQDESLPVRQLRMMRAYKAPAEIDPRPWHKIEDQGSMGSCQGQALASVIEMVVHLESGEEVQLSRMYAYLKSQEFDGIRGRDIGSTLSGGRKVATGTGICLEDVFPYPNPPRYSDRIPQDAEDAAGDYVVRSSIVCENYDDVFNYLASGQGGVQIGIAWGDQMSSQGGVIERYYPGGGGHAVCYLGYSRRQDRQQRNYLWMANSWSEQWGDGGWAEVSPAAVDQMAQHRDTVMIGYSDLKSPKPRKVSWSRAFGF